MRRKSRKSGWILAGLLAVLAGIGVVVYPFYMQYRNQKAYQDLIAQYQAWVSTLTNRQLEELQRLEQQYNQSAAAGAIRFDLYQVIRNRSEGWLGVIWIPRIGCLLPVSCGTDDEALDRGAGHAEESGLPAEETAASVVLCAHSGLPTLSAFDGIDRLQVGDQVYLYHLDRIYEYRVTGSRVSQPQEAGEILGAGGEQSDLILITCTPYGINTHRLLVSAELQTSRPMQEGGKYEKNS